MEYIFIVIIWFINYWAGSHPAAEFASPEADAYVLENDTAAAAVFRLDEQNPASVLKPEQISALTPSADLPVPSIIVPFKTSVGEPVIPS